MSITDGIAPRGAAALSALALSVIALSGCGSSSTHTTTVTSAPATTNTNAAAADERIASDAQLKLSDFPSGWQQKDSTQEAAAEAKCEGVDAAKAAASARAKSPNFERQNAQAGNVIYVYADVPGATRAVGELSSQSTRTCIGDALAKNLANQKPQGATFGKITSGQVSMTPIGDERTAGRLTIPISAQGTTVSACVDLVFVRTGRAVAVFTLLDALTPFDETLRDRLAKTVVDRLDAGLGLPSSTAAST